MRETKYLLQATPYTEIKPILDNLPDNGDEYNYVLIHCYAHIKNAEIYFEIDKDIYLNIVTYVGKEFSKAVDQYFFQMKLGAILAYKKNEEPHYLHLSDFADSFDDYRDFESEILSLIKTHKNTPAFVILSSGDKSYALVYNEAIKPVFNNQKK